MVAGTTLIVMLGVGAGGGPGTIGNDPVVPKEQLKKDEACAQMATMATPQASALDRELLFFATCMARAALSQSGRSGTLSVPTLGATAAGRPNPSD